MFYTDKIKQNAQSVTTFNGLNGIPNNVYSFLPFLRSY